MTTINFFLPLARNKTGQGHAPPGKDTKKNIVSTYFLTVKIDGIEGTDLAEVDAVYAHECVNDALSAVCDYGIAERVGHDVDRHSLLDADARRHHHLLDRDSIERHGLFCFGIIVVFGFLGGGLFVFLRLGHAVLHRLLTQLFLDLSLDTLCLLGL